MRTAIKTKPYGIIGAMKERKEKISNKKTVVKKMYYNILLPLPAESIKG
jgi:hypothetical protein